MAIGARISIWVTTVLRGLWGVFITPFFTKHFVLAMFLNYMMIVNVYVGCFYMENKL